MSLAAITWTPANEAVSLLAPLIDPSVGYLDNLLVRCDPTNCHYQGGPRYRLGRFSVDSGGRADLGSFTVLTLLRLPNPPEWKAFANDAAIAPAPRGQLEVIMDGGPASWNRSSHRPLNLLPG